MAMVQEVLAMVLDLVVDLVVRVPQACHRFDTLHRWRLSRLTDQHHRQWSHTSVKQGHMSALYHRSLLLTPRIKPKNLCLTDVAEKNVR
jgi:hypothetical protein